MGRMKWGIGAAAAVGLAWFVMNVFNWNLGGLGGDGENRVGLPTSSTSSAPDSEPSDPPEQSEPDAGLVSVENADEAIGTGGVVEVLIDDRNYSLRRGNGDEWVQAEPDAIAAYARQAAGDESGMKVRILRKPSARAAAEERLVETLHGVGLTNSEIDVPETLVE
ncbi:MAG: hypothetical protein WBC44_12565 [Planctomycetaceae bacterium]